MACTVADGHEAHRPGKTIRLTRPVLSGGRWLVCLLVLSISGVDAVPGVEAGLARPLRTIQVGPVGVVSVDSAALLHTTGVLREWLPVLAKDGLSLDGRRERVRVALLPEEASGPVGWDTSGGIARLRIPWEPALRQDDFLDALAAALTYSWLLERGSEGGVAPRWIRAGLVERFRVHLNPAHGDRLAADGALPVSGDPEFERVFSDGRGMEPALFRAWSHWFLEIARGAAGNEAGFARFVFEASRSADGGRAAFRGLVGSAAPGEEWDLWLAVCLVEFASRSRAPFLTAGESRERIDALAGTGVLRGGEADWAEVRELSELADARPLHALAAERGLAVRRLLPRVHPLYHNALLSLGILYERLPHEARVRERQRLVDAFEEDRRTAENMEEAVRSLLWAE